MAEDLFLSFLGMYVLGPKIFDYLAENINCNFRERGEFQLTSCLDKLRQSEGMTGYVVQGRCFDTGLPEVYRQTLIDFALYGRSQESALILPSPKGTGILEESKYELSKAKSMRLY